MGKSPYRVEFRSHGTEGAFARSSGFFSARHHESTPHPDGMIQWARYEHHALTFSHLATCLVLQGADLRNIFTERSFAVICDGEKDVVVWDHGPFYLLKGTLSSVGDPPLRLKDAVLACLVDYPKNLTPLEVTTYLILTLYPPG